MKSEKMVNYITNITCTKICYLHNIEIYGCFALYFQILKYIDPCLSPYTSINSKWVKDLNIRPQTLKLVQERVRNTLELIGIGKNFLDGTPAAQQLSDS
jgi:hypothetical protein